MKETYKTNGTAKKITVDALATALVCAATLVIQIPIPLGYMHLGNCCILLISVYFGKKTGMLAGGIGSALADLLSGYSQWIFPTFLIKGMMGIVIAEFAYREEKQIRMLSLRTFLGTVAGIMLMIAGYTVAGCVLYGKSAAGLAQIPGLTAEGMIGLILFYVIGFSFEKAKIPQLIKHLA